MAELNPSPAGVISGPIEAFRHMLADCPAWQTLTGTASLTEALEHVYTAGFEDEMAEPVEIQGLDDLRLGNAENTSENGLTKSDRRPFAVIDLPETNPFVYTALSGGVSGNFVASGTMLMHLEVNAVAGLDDGRISAPTRRFENTLGAILQEMGSRSFGEAGGVVLPNVKRFQVLTIERTDETQVETEGDAFFATVLITWGHAGGGFGGGA